MNRLSSAMSLTIRGVLVSCVAGTAAILSSCQQDVLVFPTPDPAKVCIVNTTQDVAFLETLIDATTPVVVRRGEASSYTQASAGRPIGFVLKSDGENLRRDTLFYTLGGNARVILFARGSRSRLVEFRRALQDTTLAPNSNPVIRFVHMAENTDRFVTLEVYETKGNRAFTEVFDPGIASAYTSFTPGPHTFEIREWETTNVAAQITVDLQPGKSYIMYAYDAAPPRLDSIAVGIF